MIRNHFVPFMAVLLFAFAAGCSGLKAFEVAEVVQNAGRLDGKTIRVRGKAYLWINPSRATMWLYGGGCAVKLDPNERQGYVKGWLTLYDAAYPDEWGGAGAPHDEKGVKVSESSFRCEGDYCRIACSPFEVVSERMYEFVGTLQINDSEFILENVDLDQSRQLVDGKWTPVQRGNFEVMFP
jgi:hypothetical protein